VQAQRELLAHLRAFRLRDGFEAGADELGGRFDVDRVAVSAKLTDPPFDADPERRDGPNGEATKTHEDPRFRFVTNGSPYRFNLT